MARRPAPSPLAASRPAGSRSASNATAVTSPEQHIQACAAQLSGRALAVDTLITSLKRAIEQPNNEKYRKVNISNKAFQERVASVPGGIEFLYAVGFDPMHGHLVLQVHPSSG